MSAQLLEELRTVAADIFAVAPSQINADSTPESVDNWDSISHVSLVVAIEEQYGVSFHPDEIVDMLSLGKIAELLAAKLNNA